MTAPSPEACVAAFAEAMIRRDMPAALQWLSDDVLFIYSNGTTIAGKGAFETTMTANWGVVSDYRYESADAVWIAKSETVAALVYHFSWSGIARGEAVGGGGRGTRVLRNTGDGWRIVHEHLSTGASIARPAASASA